MTDGLRIAHLRIAPQWAILRWAILTFASILKANADLQMPEKILISEKVRIFVRKHRKAFYVSLYGVLQCNDSLKVSLGLNRI